MFINFQKHLYHGYIHHMKQDHSPPPTPSFFYITFENIVLVFYKFAVASRQGTETNFSQQSIQNSFDLHH